jgi:MFS family permease
VRGFTAVLAAAQVTTVAFTGVAFALSTVWLVKRFGVSYVMLGAMFNFTVGSILIAAMPGNQIYWLQTFFSALIMPGAMNLSFPAATILLSSALPKEKQGIAASLVTTLVNYSISCGLGLAGSIHRQTFTAAINRRFGDNPPAPEVLSITPEGFPEIRMESFRGPLWFAVALGAFGMFCATVFIIVNKLKGKFSEKDFANLRPKSMMFFPKEMASRLSLVRERTAEL